MHRWIESDINPISNALEVVAASRCVRLECAASRAWKFPHWMWWSSS
jgi:hypothetical protein